MAQQQTQQNPAEGTKRYWRIPADWIRPCNQRLQEEKNSTLSPWSATWDRSMRALRRSSEGVENRRRGMPGRGHCATCSSRTSCPRRWPPTPCTRTSTARVRAVPAADLQVTLWTRRTFGAKYIAHGCTGKGNDQVRFEASIPHA